MDRRNVILVALVVAFTGVLGTYAKARTSTPEVVGIGEIPLQVEGRFVEVTGLLAAIRDSAAGTRLLLRDPTNGAGVSVILGSAGNLGDAGPGTTVRVRGTVAMGRSAPVIESDARDVSILRTPEENRLSVRALLAHPRWFDGMGVVVCGEPAGLRWTGSRLDGNLTGQGGDHSRQGEMLAFRVHPYPTLPPDLEPGERLVISGSWWLDGRTGTWTVHGTGLRAVGIER